MKICLATQHRTPAFIPLALMYLKACLVEREGLAFDDVRILEFGPDAGVDEIVRDIVAAAPGVVGFSCYVWNVKHLLAAVRQLKARLPGVNVVLGGPEVGPVAAEVLERNPNVDVIVRSEGELPLSDLVRAWNADGDLTSVKGISFRRGDAVVHTEDAPIVNDLDEFPSPHVPRYADNYERRIVCIETQRGCVFRCNFCFYNKDLSIRNRRFDLDRVKDEILFWLDQDIVELYLMDPVFNLNAERAKAICRFLADHNRRAIPLHAEIWAEFVDDEMASLMRAANFQFLEVGLQTTDTTALATVERRLKLQRFLDGVAHLKRHKLKFELQLIYGLPGETRSSFKKSLNFAMSLNPDDLAVFPLMILPGTELWRKAEALKVRFDDEPPYFAVSHCSMSAADFAYGRSVIEASAQLQRSRTARLLSREPGLTYADLVDEWIAWAPEHKPDDLEGETIRRFVAHVCEQRQIPPQFYDQFGALELSAEPSAARPSGVGA